MIAGFQPSTVYSILVSALHRSILGKTRKNYPPGNDHISLPIGFTFELMIFRTSRLFGRICGYGCFQKWRVPPKHRKMIIFSRKTHEFVGETQHFRNPPYVSATPGSGNLMAYAIQPLVSTFQVSQPSSWRRLAQAKPWPMSCLLYISC